MRDGFFDVEIDSFIKDAVARDADSMSTPMRIDEN